METTNRVRNHLYIFKEHACTYVYISSSRSIQEIVNNDNRVRRCRKWIYCYIFYLVSIHFCKVCFFKKQLDVILSLKEK